ncbi:hypothetical protein M501DRAFT_1008886 [Patellaria atrata CBS 101060]|uniref:Pentatricopeptide repeat protein n=1 Tax=Patellaria atrata CBS 101060 TaxID=1346257 RepID=A0A9P4VMR6_9PEZI|nr:hypothetical protein M501DRAFT_1008886 [Patellaria atrata CBS 101060]
MTERRAMMELRYLPDPLALAEHVRKTLKAGDEAKAIALVHMANKQGGCIVSWNHLMDYQMSQGRIKGAFKTYNEMKKRGQMPDSHTFVILFRGLADHAHHADALGKALSLFHSMGAANSHTKPAIIHANAVLKVCARANNMDALWGIIAKLPERGPGSADNMTYTTILNALRQQVLMTQTSDMGIEEIARQKDTAVIDGRRIWDDIVSRWKKGDLIVDEPLVAAMGRLLLVGIRPRDWDDVLSLVEQTMNIPRQVPRLDTPERANSSAPTIRAPNTPEQMKLEDANEDPDAPRRGDEFIAIDTTNSSSTDPTKPARKHRSLAYAKPTSNTLSMVLEACLKTVSKKTAKQYWDLLTKDFDVAPDLDNLTMYMRLLRFSRSSGQVVELLKEDVVKRGLPLYPKMLRIAMSTCVRDKNNPNAIANAGEIMELANQLMPHPDPGSLRLYLELLGTSSDPNTRYRQAGHGRREARSRLGREKGANGSGSGKGAREEEEGADEKGGGEGVV